MNTEFRVDPVKRLVGVHMMQPLPSGFRRTSRLAPLHHSVYHGVMALNLKNADVERLAADVARLTGESKTEAIRRALDERQRRLTHTVHDDRRERVMRFLKKKVWPTLPKMQLGRRLSRKEEDDILGFGPDGI